MGPGVEVQTFDRLTLLGRRYYFRIVDTSNWKVLAPSEGYNRAIDRNATANRLARLMNCAVVPERSKR